MSYRALARLPPLPDIVRFGQLRKDDGLRSVADFRPFVKVNDHVVEGRTRNGRRGAAVGVILTGSSWNCYKLRPFVDAGV